jgi:translation initiation factor 5B
LPDAEEEAATKEVQVFRERIIYRVIEDYLSWLKDRREARLEENFQTLVKPAKIQVMEGYVFRRAKPAIFGVTILAGNIRPKYTLLRADNGEEVGEIQQIQDKGEALPEAQQGMQVAVSMDRPTFGRHIFEKDVLYVKVSEQQVRALQSTFSDRLTVEEQQALDEYVNVMRKKVPYNC